MLNQSNILTCIVNGKNLLCGFLLLFTLQCSLFDPKRSEPKPQFTVPQGMVPIFAEGKSFIQGSSDGAATIDEKPPFTSSFSYNFAIDSTEVTISSYYAVTGKLPAKYDSAPPTSDDCPVSFVTWFDAALFCNCRSKKSGFDTVYLYTSIDSTPTGSVYRLNGFTTDLLAEGFRLPTEAEWEFAAHGSRNSLYIWGDTFDSTRCSECCWWSANSSERIHPVAELKKNSYGLYDMSGNVMEWVNDFRGAYPTDLFINYLGPASSSHDYRPVKGGCYRHPPEKMRIPTRNDNYETLSSSATASIGFRCAFGPIENGHYSIEGGGSAADMPALQPAASPSVPVPSRFVFINTNRSLRTLCTIDFSTSASHIEQYFDSVDVYYPTISPDGKWIAWATNDEGAIDGSIVALRTFTPSSTVLRLPDAPAFTPRWWIDPSTSDTFIIYTGSAVLNSDPVWTTTVTRMIRFSNGMFPDAPVTVNENGSFHDGLSADGRYLATGYDRLLMKDRQTAETRILFTGPNNGKGTGDTSQVCNASIAPGAESIPEVLFLDFGYPRTGSIVPKPYATHEILFRVSWDNIVTGWYAAPQSYVWSDPEWSNGMDYAAAGLEAQNGTHPEVGIVNLATGIYTPVVTGKNLATPWLWTGRKDSGSTATFSIDSAGYYNDPPTDIAQAILSWKIPLFWKYRSRCNAYIVGSSHVLHGIVPQLITGYQALNLGVTGGDLQTSVRLIEDYVLNQCGDSTLIIMEFMIGFFDQPSGNVSWSTGFPVSKGYTYDKNHGFWKDELSLDFLNLVARAPNAPPAAPDSTLGFLPFLSAEAKRNNPLLGGWGGDHPDVREDDWTIDNPQCIENLALIDSLIGTLEKRNMSLIGVLLPENPAYRTLGYHGRYGATLETAETIIAHFRERETKHPLFHLYDANLCGLHDYTDDDAGDMDHLNELGAIKFTQRLDSLIASISAGK